MASVGQDSSFAAVPDAVFAGLTDGDGVIVDTKSLAYYGLNETAAFLWARLQQAAAAGQGVGLMALVDAVCDEFEIDRPDAESDVRSFLDHVLRYGLARRVGQGGPAAGEK